MKRVFFFLLLICFFCSGCGIVDYYFLKPKPQTPLELLEAGRDALSEKDYDSAIKYFEKIKDRYPFSPYTRDAEFLLAESYFYAKKYEEAESAYKEFESLHPGDKRIDYVLFQIGKCNYLHRLSIDLPQLSIEEALSYFRRLVEGYPHSKYLDEAKKYIRKCRYLMAKHEVYVGNFYFRTKRYRGAWKRFVYIEKHFPEFKDIVSYAKYMERVSYIKYEMKVSEDKREQQFGGIWTKIKKWL